MGRVLLSSNRMAFPDFTASKISLSPLVSFASSSSSPSFTVMALIPLARGREYCSKAVFHLPLLGGHNHIVVVDVLLVFKVLRIDKGFHLIVLLNINEVLYRSSLLPFSILQEFQTPASRNTSLFG